MYTRIVACTALLAAVAIMLSLPLAADEPLRGLVVDRGDNVLWLGFPKAAEKGTVFNVMLLPGSEVVARATIVEATPDAPYVAKATFKMLDNKAFIPIGAYVEAAKIAVAETDRSPGYQAATLGPKGPNPLSFQAGVFFPSNDQLQDETDRVWPTVQLNYRICKHESMETSIGLGYLGRTSKFPVGLFTGVRNIHVFPVTIDARFKLSGGSNKGWYGRAGVGAYIVDDRRGIPSLVDEHTNTTTIGWKAGLGYQSGRTSAELGYLDAQQEGIRGVSFTLGARF